MFFMFGSFCFLMGVLVWFLVPETKGISLEKMDELFGVTAGLDKIVSGLEEGQDATTTSIPHDTDADAADGAPTNNKREVRRE